MKTKGKEVAQVTTHRDLTAMDEMDRMFDAFFRHGWLRSFSQLWPEWTPFDELADPRSPRVDFIERETEYFVKAELPGVKREDLRLELSGEQLTISGEHRHEERAEDDNYMRSEITRGAFSRTLRLPTEVDPDQVQADFKDGVLEVHLSKLAKAERRQIEIS